ncbi:hypothetical protein [Agarivorans sp.]|uniref:hypothetical protein n=1 Tax=Agarivorans sp. TaxID=1872412 RepID=UPI003D00912B
MLLRLSHRFLFTMLSVGMQIVSFASYALDQSLNITIPPLKTVSEVHYFVLPIGNSTISEQQGFQLEQGSKSLTFRASAHLFWPNTSEPRYYRAVLFAVEGLRAGPLTLSWGEDKLKPREKLFADPNWLIDVELPEAWLNLALYSPVIYQPNNLEWGWFDKAHWRYASFSADESLIAQQHKPKDPTKKATLPSTSASPWLFDRPYNFYQLYFKSGDLHWKRVAHQQAQFFISKLDRQGDFTLKGRADLKYMLSAGLLLDYLFYPSPQTREAIEKMTAKGLAWPERYSSRLGFWTERHLSSAFNLAVNQWELDGSASAHARVQQLLEGIKADLKVNQAGSGACIQHRLKVHTGKNSEVMVCSPWMSALLVEQLWRYYWITKDVTVAMMIIDFAELLLERGIYTVEHKGTTLYIPDYLVYFGESIFQERNSWNDRQHGCDVAGMVYKAVHLKRQRQQDDLLLSLLADELFNTCHRTAYQPGSRAEANPAWALKPLRKFNWWFTGNGSLTWILQQ